MRRVLKMSMLTLPDWLISFCTSGIMTCRCGRCGCCEICGHWQKTSWCSPAGYSADQLPVAITELQQSVVCRCGRCGHRYEPHQGAGIPTCCLLWMLIFITVWVEVWA